MSSSKRDFLPRRTNAMGVEADSESLNTWRKMPNDQYIDNIDTTASAQDQQKIDYNLLVSSVPSPWARVHMTSHAIGRELKEGDTRMLMKIYEFMRSEWRGLVAAYVLHPDYFQLTKPVELASIDIMKREGKCDILSTFAEMLFEDTALWKYEKGGMDTPKLQLLHYVNGTERQLVGATSPFTIFFTGLNYKVAQDEDRIFWVTELGKFCDPLTMPMYFTKGEPKCKDKHFENMRKLYSFLCNVQKNREAYINVLRGIWDSEPQHKGDKLSATPDSRCNFVSKVIDDAIILWKKDLEKVLDDVAAKSVNQPVNLKPLEGPLGTLVAMNNVFYWRNNTFCTDEGLLVNMEDLFIKSDTLAIWADASYDAINDQGVRQEQKEHDYRRSPVYFLEVKENGQSWFVALPLSPYAIDKIFKNEFESIIQGSSESKVKLEAEKHGNQVDVRLRAKVDSADELTIIRQHTFNVVVPNQNQKVFVWPNFYSSEWTKYYYYSEFPINGPDVQMVPMFDGMEDVEEIQNMDKDAFAHLIKYPETATSSDHVYEIMRTNRPLKRIKIRKQIGSKLQELGYLQLRTTTNPLTPDGPLAMRQISFDTPKEAIVGFDFGSTNSCAYYKASGKQEIEPVPFKNHRLPIIGFDNKPTEEAEPDELLFISNEEPINKNGQVKSWLHEHNEQYIANNGVGHDEELVGGVPVNETNITVKSMDAYEITTNAGRLRYNMKWLVDEVGQRRKQAFVKMLWVHICADLFEEGCYPIQINWSYPSAMGARDMTAMKSIFSNLPVPCPKHQLKNRKSYTEAEAVCSYFNRKGVPNAPQNLYFGVDIGGTTSDILIFGPNRDGAQTQQQNNFQQPVQQNIIPAPKLALPEGPYYTVENGMQAGPFTGQQLLEKKNAGLFTPDTMVYKVGMPTWTPANAVPELAAVFAPPAIPPIPGGMVPPPIPGGMVPPPPPAAVLPKVQYFAIINGQQAGPLDAQTLLNTKNMGQLNQQTPVWTNGMPGWAPAGSVAELAFLFQATTPPPYNQTPSVSTQPQSKDLDTAKPYRLFTQCSLRMAAGMFFNAIINSKKFRDCIRRFHNTHQTRINVVGIDTMEQDPKRAPYYLNNIFDQLGSDRDFTKFYSYLQSDVPFVFALPAYITGALMAYAGMLTRNTILKRNLHEVSDVHFRYFGKGGRLFEWLFFAFEKSEISSYLNRCFKVGLKDKLINKAFNKPEDNRIILHFENVENESDFGERIKSENKSEVAYGLVAQHNDIAGIKPVIEGYEEEEKNASDEEKDARKQEIIGEIGVKFNGQDMDELDYVADNFYRNPNAVVMPASFQNFNEFISVYVKFLSNIYPNANLLKEQSKKVDRVLNFIMNDTEYQKYIDTINKGDDDSYRMPVFVASTLYFLQEVLLKEVFKE